ncbi:MAG: hypothetical protein Q8P61_07735 [Candidatus Nanopelagicales bacterium]|nr:hypothetical protein [Candidatus Nanopelagicales bacterium]
MLKRRGAGLVVAVVVAGGAGLGSGLPAGAVPADVVSGVSVAESVGFGGVQSRRAAKLAVGLTVVVSGLPAGAAGSVVVTGSKLSKKKKGKAKVYRAVVSKTTVLRKVDFRTFRVAGMTPAFGAR